MDTGEYETNALIVLTSSSNNISSIAYRFYEPSVELSQTFLPTALDIESALRSDGCLVFYDAPRQGIWHFRCLNKAGQSGPDDFPTSLDPARYGLVLGDQGVLEPPALLKARGQAPAQATGNAAAAMGPEQASRQPLAAAGPGNVSALRDQERREPHAPGMETEAGAAATQKAVYESFVIALLLTISAAFCRQTGAIPLNYRNVLFPPPDGARAFAPREAVMLEKHPVIGTLRTFLTTTGSLVLSLAVTRCKGLLPLVELAAPHGITPQSQRILAAPFGIMAKSQPGVSGDGTMSLAQTPTTQALSFRSGFETQDSLWKQTCLRYLQYRGVPILRLQGGHWVPLLISRPQGFPCSSSVVSLPWPGSLCFRKRAVDVSSTSRVVDSVLSGHEETHDPLGSARNWFNSAAEREEKVSKRNAERAAALPSQTSSAESKLVSFNDNPTMAMRRPSGQSGLAAAVVYPTPPSGVTQSSGFNSLIDGTLSSPSNPLSVPTASDLDNTALTTASAVNGLGDGPESAGPKRQQNDGNLLGGDASNMFVDMGGDLFDENDITEADFNFFDQQPTEMDLDVVVMGDLVPPVSVASAPALKVEAGTRHGSKELAPNPRLAAQPTVFAKPELRHARSSQNGGSTRRGRDMQRPGSNKRESSPFDAYGVFKRVRASLPAATTYGGNVVVLANRQKRKEFEKVEFDPRLPLINKKYEPGGPYDWAEVSSQSSRIKKVDPWILPETDYLKRHGKLGRKVKDKPPPLNMLMRTLTGLDPPALSSPSKLGESVSERDDSSIESDQDDSSYTTEEPSSPQKLAIRYTNADDDALSQVPSMRELDLVEELDHQLAMELVRLAKPDTSEIAFSAFFVDPEPAVPDMSLADEDLIQVAQILTEQAATGSLDICNLREADESLTVTMGQTRHGLPPNGRGALRVLEDVASQFLGAVSPLRLKGLLDVQDIPVLPQPSRMVARQMPGRAGENNGEAARPSNLYQMPSPHLEVRRADTKLSVLPSAVTFWDSLGLAPSSGSKSINAVCVFPGWSGMRDSARALLDRLKSVYEFLKLGSFDTMALGPDLEDGLLPYEVDRISTSPDATVTGHGSALVESMEALRGPFSGSTATETNFVLYFVYSPGNPATIVEACTAFQRFWETYRRSLAVKQKPALNDLVLQLVSIDMFSSSNFLVVTPAPELVKLCMETYDRCTLFGGPMPAPAIKIEQLLPRLIDFKLTNTPSASLIRENSCIHISYAQSVDERWVAAAWTDDGGNQQTTASYCLGRKGKPLSRTMNEVAHEIWETTLGLISMWRVHWRIIITRSGPMNQQEMDFWVDLARTEINATVTMILMTVDTAPSLQLFPPVVKLPGSLATIVCTTPVSTPQPSAASPEQTSTPTPNHTPRDPAQTPQTATPTPTPDTPAATAAAATAAEADADAALADISDQTWGAIANHRLNNSISLLEIRPALISGYLIKRTGMRVEDAPSVMEVSLVHTDTGPRAYEPLLREMLSHFRGLGTLARARGVVDKETDVRPWHVAAAEKAVRALYLLM